MGKIEVRFSEVVDVKSDTDDDYELVPVPNLTACATAAHPKALSTGKGQVICVIPKINSSTRQRGDLIDKVTIHYCTAAGLLHIGVLSPWEWLRAKAPLTKRQKIDPRLAAIQPKILNVQTVIEDGVLLVKGGRRELFDLSELSSDDDDDDDDDDDNSGEEEDGDNQKRSEKVDNVQDNGPRKRGISASAFVSQPVT